MKCPNYPRTDVGDITGITLDEGNPVNDVDVEDEFPVHQGDEKEIRSFRTIAQPMECSPKTERDYRFNPFPAPDKTLVAWEVRRNRLPELPKLPFVDNISATTNINQFLRDRLNPEQQQQLGALSDDDWISLWKDFDKQQLSFNERDRDIIRKLFQFRNSAVVQTSPTLANCLGTNTNALLLGSLEQAKAILFYLLKYITKDSVQLASTVSVIKYAQDKKKEYGSLAEDAGTVRRDGIHFLQIILNKLTGLKELSDTQAAAALLGMPSQETTCKTKYVFILAAIAAAKQHYLQDAGDSGDKAWHVNPNEEMLQDDHNDDDNALFQGFDAELLNVQNQIGADSDFIPANSTSSKAPNFGSKCTYLQD